MATSRFEGGLWDNGTKRRSPHRRKRRLRRRRRGRSTCSIKKNPPAVSNLPFQATALARAQLCPCLTRPCTTRAAAMATPPRRRSSSRTGRISKPKAWCASPAAGGPQLGRVPPGLVDLLLSEPTVAPHYPRRASVGWPRSGPSSRSSASVAREALLRGVLASTKMTLEARDNKDVPQLRPPPCPVDPGACDASLPSSSSAASAGC